MTSDRWANGDSSSSTDGASNASMSIGELARRTGIAVGNLRMWEARHGFPRAVRLPSGHRRYDETTIDLVLQVQRRREAGVRLEAAISEVSSSPTIPPASIYAELRTKHPELLPHRLRKSTLIALTWALEDECGARAQTPWLFGAFQTEDYYHPARRRWQDLSRTAKGVWALGDFSPEYLEQARNEQGPSPTMVPIAEDSPMRREWSVVCLAPDYPAVLTAWELPGQHGIADSDRLFESVWSLEQAPARDAAKCCAHLLASLGHDTSEVLADADSPHYFKNQELRHATDTFNRVVAYVDRLC